MMLAFVVVKMICGVNFVWLKVVFSFECLVKLKVYVINGYCVSFLMVMVFLSVSGWFGVIIIVWF